MKITFFSNFLNHHQLPFCQEMIKILGKNFTFVATEQVPEERIKLGYKDMNEDYDFVVCSYKDEKKALQLGIESDIVIIGSAPDKFIYERLKKKKVTLRYNERIYRDENKLKIFLYTFLNRTLKERKNVYLLTASAFSTYDFNITGAYKNKCFKWGYFPKVKEYKDINEVINKKQSKSILWVARFIECKHPEIVIEIACRLKKEKYKFHINMIGVGEMYNQISEMIIKKNLENEIKLLGAMSPKNVRKYMENSEVFLFTSDKKEGWGAVLNEAMNSGCAVIASHEIGSVPYLIKDKKNGFIFENGNLNDLYNKTKMLLDNNILSKKIGMEAYNTMINLWNPEIAAKRLINFCKDLLQYKRIKSFSEGPLSIAEKMKDTWYKGE